MRILLIGGGSGGHITPLLAVARELKELDAHTELIAVCEKGSRFVHLYEDAPEITSVEQIPAGKFRRYGGRSILEKITDVQTLALNSRDVGRTFRGYSQALKLLKKYRPDAILVKGGFVAVPIGLAAARLKLPFITHDSDSTPGLANRIISKWAVLHATGMPAELYTYPKQSTFYTGIPLFDKFRPVTPELQASYQRELGADGRVLTVVGGSQGGGQLNIDVIANAKRWFESYPDLCILHIAGAAHIDAVEQGYDAILTKEQRSRVVVRGFVHDPEVHTGAADVVITRAGATAIAELAVQAKPIILVPGQLAGSHQQKNTKFLVGEEAALQAAFGDAQGLFDAVSALMSDLGLRNRLAANLAVYARPDAAKQLAELTMKVAKGRV